jgi:transposase-like protein
MTDDKMTLLKLVQKSDDGSFLRELVQFSLQRLMSFEIDGLCGAGPHERSETRVNQRNGYRDRSWETRLGTLDLRIPKLRHGSYFPAFLEARKTAEWALVAVIQEAVLTGELLPVEKTAQPVPESAPLGDRAGMAYSGTSVATGAGVGGRDWATY